MTPAEIFAAHRAGCSACKSIDLERPATLAHACIEGSRLFKDAAAQAHRELTEQMRRNARAADRRREEDDTAMGGGSR